MQLMRYEAARTALAECQRVDEVKDIRDKSIAMEAYARQAKDSNLMQMAAEIKVRAERRLGEMLREQKETVGMAKPGRISVDDDDRIPTLTEVGISKDLSSRSQQLAAMPADHFETAISSAKETAKAVSASYMLRLGEAMRENAEIRAETERLRRDNYAKYLIKEFDSAIYWLRIGADADQPAAADQIEEARRKLDEINRLAEKLLGETHEYH